LAAASVWSLLHGFVTLQLEDQLPHTLTQSYSPREILTALLNQITLQPVV
jgi:hypothetical protein